MPNFDDPLPFDAGDPFDAEPGAFDADTPFDGGDFEMLLFEAADKALALRVGTDSGGLPIFAGMDGFCGSFPANAKLLALVVGSDDYNRPIFAVSKQRCEGTGTNFEVGKLYLALVVGADADGKPVLASFCVQCEGGEPPTIITCPEGGTCTSVEVPAAGFTLSLTDSNDHDFYQLGDYTLTYQEDVMVFVQCLGDELGAETLEDGVFTDIIPFIDPDLTDLGLIGLRYKYEPCTGVLAAIQYQEVDCGLAGLVTVADLVGTVATFDILDCDPYSAEADGGAGQFTATITE
jgi:hypothetical protein